MQLLKTMRKKWILLKITKKCSSLATFVLSLVILLIGCFFPDFRWLNVLIFFVSLLSVLLLIWQLASYNHEHKMLYEAAAGLIAIYFAVLFFSPKGRIWSNLQNYISAAALLVTTIQFAWQEKEDKDKDNKTAVPPEKKAHN